MSTEPKNTDGATPEDPRSRREFLDYCIGAGLAIGTAVTAVPAAIYVFPVTATGPTKTLEEVCQEEDMKVWEGKKVAVSGHAVWVVRTPRDQDKGYVAVSAVCPHLACNVEWNAGKHEFECPCHAGFFDHLGKVISGPPPAALEPLNIKIVGGKVLVSA